MSDGSVRFVKDSDDSSTWRVIATKGKQSYTHSRSCVRSVRTSNLRFPISNQQTERTKSLESV